MVLKVEAVLRRFLASVGDARTDVNFASSGALAGRSGRFDLVCNFALYRCDAAGGLCIQELYSLRAGSFPGVFQELPLVHASFAAVHVNYIKF